MPESCSDETPTADSQICIITSYKPDYKAINQTTGGKDLCAYNPDVCLYEHAHAVEGGGGATLSIEPDYIIHVHVAMASRD